MGFFKDNASDLISAGGGILSTLIQNAFNVKQQQRANAHNREMVELQNAAAAQESEKAYQRSTPINQIGNMRAAGMSFAGAVNALNGGGSYQPAPVNSAQDTAPQVDLSGISNALQGFAQLKQQRELADKQLKASKEQQQAQFAENAKQREHDLEMQSREHANTNRNADNRLAFDKEQFEFNKPKIQAEINQIRKNTKVLEEVAKGHNLDNIRKEFENARLPTLAKLADIQAWQSIQYCAMKLAHEDAEHMNKQERDSLELEFLRATMDSSINLQNVKDELQIYLSASELGMYKTPVVGDFIAALNYVMNNLAPKFALFK